MRSVLLLVLLLCAVRSVSSQDRQPSRAAFEVASVKVSATADDQSSWRLTDSPLVRISNMTLRRIIGEVHGINPAEEQFRIEGGPEPLLSTRFDINATRPAGTPASENRSMLRVLLAERFGLRIARASRNRPAYALSVARKGRFGPNLTRAELDCSELQARNREAFRPGMSVPPPPSACVSYGFGVPGALTIRYSAPIAELVTRIQGFVDRPIVDATGLSGPYSWELTFAIRNDSDLGGIYTALDEQLGLTLQPITADIDVLVIESVTMPTPD